MKNVLLDMLYVYMQPLYIMIDTFHLYKDPLCIFLNAELRMTFNFIVLPEFKKSYILKCVVCFCFQLVSSK